MSSFNQQHAIESIVRISIYMAQQYQKPGWHCFDILLIKHLRLLSVGKFLFSVAIFLNPQITLIIFISIRNYKKTIERN